MQAMRRPAQAMAIEADRAGAAARAVTAVARRDDSDRHADASVSEVEAPRRC